jgi:acid phosphatase family membrane protein YuiD
MEQLQAITSNYIINLGVTSWILAQLLKTLFTLISTRKFEPERLFGAGGMPSSHSALTISIAIGMAKKLGFASPEFGLALAFAAIVMYDAMGVRRAAGEQAKVLNRIVFEFPFFQKPGQQEQEQEQEREREDEAALAGQPDEPDALPFLDKELKEFLGHTPLEVFGGFLLGILVAVFMPVV